MCRALGVLQCPAAGCAIVVLCHDMAFIKLWEQTYLLRASHTSKLQVSFVAKREFLESYTKRGWERASGSVPSMYEKQEEDTFCSQKLIEAISGHTTHLVQPVTP